MVNVESMHMYNEAKAISKFIKVLEICCNLLTNQQVCFALPANTCGWFFHYSANSLLSRVMENSMMCMTCNQDQLQCLYSCLQWAIPMHCIHFSTVLIQTTVSISIQSNNSKAITTQHIHPALFLHSHTVPCDHIHVHVSVHQHLAKSELVQSVGQVTSLYNRLSSTCTSCH